MRKLVYYVAASLDGCIAGPNAEVDFYPQSARMAASINERYPETVPTSFRVAAGVHDRPNRSFDTVIMGRAAYESAAVLSPYAHLRQYVLSRTSTTGHTDGPIVEDDAVGLVRRLKSESGELDIWLCGGGRLAGSLLPEIDELIIKSYPVVAGSGIPLFDGPFDPTVFTPTHRESFDNGAGVTWLRRSGSQPAAGHPAHAPRITRIVPNLPVMNVGRATESYAHVLGLETGMQLDWIGNLSPADASSPQLQVLTRDETGPCNPVVSIGVATPEEVDAIHGRALAAGLEVVHPLTDEPWGVHRFFFADRDGNVVNVVAHN